MARAQNNSLGKNDPDAKKVLDALSTKLKSYKAIQSNFTSLKNSIILISPVSLESLESRGSVAPGNFKTP